MELFVNRGFGWNCRRCAENKQELTRARDSSLKSRARFFDEGEAEDKGAPPLSAPSLARWKDEARTILVCPRCGAEEKVDV